MNLKVTFYVIISFISVLVIIYLGSGYFRESDEKLNEPVQKVILKDSLPVEGNPKLINEHNSPDTAQISIVPKTKSDGEVKDNDVLIEKTKPKIKLIAYYFHPTARCQTCLNIENFTKEVIETQFEKEVNEGLITYRVLNIEDSVNEHYVDEYNLQFSSLIIVKYIGGKKDKWKNLEEIWKLVNDKSSFIKYVIHELNQFVKEKSEK